MLDGLPVKYGRIHPLAQGSLLSSQSEWLQEHGDWNEGKHCLDPSIHHAKGCRVVDWVTGRE
jgi:hypothetical protein